MGSVTFSNQQIERFGGSQKIKDFITDNRKKLASGEKVAISNDVIEILGIDNVRKILAKPAQLPQNNQNSSFMGNVGSVIGRGARAFGSGVAGAIDGVAPNQLAFNEYSDETHINENYLTDAEKEKLKNSGYVNQPSYEDLSRHRMFEGAPGLQETIDNLTGYDRKKASGWEKAIETATTVGLGGVKAPVAIGIGLGQYIQNPYNHEKNPVAAFFFDMARDALAGALGQRASTLGKAIKNLPKTAENLMRKQYAKALLEGMSDDAKKNFFEAVNKGLIVDPREYVDQPGLWTSLANKLYLKHSGKGAGADIKFNRKYLEKALEESFDTHFKTKRADYDELIQAIREAPRANSEANKVIKELFKSKKPISLEQGEKSIADFLKGRSIMEEEMQAVRKTLSYFDANVHENPFFQLYEKQLSNKFKNFTKGLDLGKTIDAILTGKEKTTKIQMGFQVGGAQTAKPKPLLKKNLVDDFKKFVRQCGENGIDVRETSTIKELLKTYKKNHKRIKQAFANNDDAIVFGITDQSLREVPMNRALQTKENFKNPYSENTETRKKNIRLTGISDKMSQDIKKASPEYAGANADIAQRKSKNAYGILEKLESPLEDKKSVFGSFDDIEDLKKLNSLIPSESQQVRVQKVRGLKAKDMLSEAIGSGSAEEVSKKISNNRKYFEALLGEKNVDNFSEAVEKIGEYAKGVMFSKKAGPLKELAGDNTMKNLAKGALGMAGFSVAGFKAFIVAPAIRIAFRSANNKMSQVMTSKSFANDVKALAEAYGQLKKSYPNRLIEKLVKKGKEIVKETPNKLIKNRAVIAANLNKFEKSKDDKSKR